MDLPLSFSRLDPSVGIAVLAGVGLAVLLLYLLKPPPQRREVASLQIWEKLARQRSRRRDLWRWLLSLLLSAALAAALAAAWTGLSGGGSTLRQPLVVIDVAPSMATRTASGASRFERALELAERIGRRAAPPIGLTTTAGDRLFVAGDAAQFSAGLSQLAERWRPRLGDPAHAAALAFPAPPAGAFTAVDLVLLTDGVQPLDPPPDAAIWSVFEPAVNVALTAFEVRSDPANASSAYVEVRNDSTEAVETRLVVRDDGVGTDGKGDPENRPLAEQALRLSPGESWSGRLRLPAATQARRITARVTTPDDALPGDDDASALLRPMRLRVFTDLDPSSPIARSLAANPHFQLVTRVDAVGSVLDRSLADVAVLGRTTPDRAPAVPALLLAPAQTDWLPRPDAARDQVRPERLELLAGVTALEELEIEQTALWDAAALPAAASPLLAPPVEGEEPAALGFLLPGGPAERAGEQGGETGAVLVLGFRPEASNWSRLPLFPVVLDELLTGLATHDLDAPPQADPPRGAEPPPALGVNQQQLAANRDELPPRTPLRRESWLLFALLALLAEPVLRRWGITE
ncbi:MAG: hypothetical protein DWQ36_04175 [Acidobacteria bacterium]|nr:MAG: hypothetical protein DWQ30_17455 [Acidobacteriota bacterium]REK10498.1 MAG: hypothetical protein DWQ36_04175 [Acidobacteriota bacterium]